MTDNTNFSYKPGDIVVAKLPEQYQDGNGRYLLPSGSYIIGDPCYSVGSDDDAWQDFTSLGWAQDNVVGLFNEYPVIGIGTAFGDGAFKDTKHPDHVYSVDAGLIGAVPVKLLESMRVNPKEYDNLTTVLTVSEGDTLIISEDDGQIFFRTKDAEISINTNG